MKITFKSNYELKTPKFIQTNTDRVNQRLHDWHNPRSWTINQLTDLNWPLDYPNKVSKFTNIDSPKY